MKISKSKRQLAQLLIEAGVTRFPEDANWAAQDKRNPHKGYTAGITLYASTPEKPLKGGCYWGGYTTNSEIVMFVETNTLIPNWHQTVLSRDEFDQIVAESAVERSEPDCGGWVEWSGGECPVKRGTLVDVKYANGVTNYGVSALTDKTSADHVRGTAGSMLATNWGPNLPMSGIVSYRPHKPEQVEPQYCESVTRSIPEPTAVPTLDRLLQDWRNADDFAQRKQTEADEAAVMRDERWQAVQARAGEMGVTVGRCESVVNESKLVITDWRDLRVGDVIWWSGDSKFSSGEYPVCDLEERDHTGPYPILLDVGGCNQWVDHDTEEWRFIRRP